MVRIRLVRKGTKNKPTYRILVADQRKATSGSFIENIGHFNPRTEPETIVVDVDRANHWIARGAQPTPAVQRLLKAAATEPAVGTGTDKPADAPDREVAADSPDDGTSEMNGEVKLENDFPDIAGSSHLSENSGDSEGEFAQHFHSVQATRPSPAVEQPVPLPEGGSNTSQSAKDDTARSSRLGRTEPRELKVVTLSVRGPESRALEAKFRNMIKLDYGNRCQICGKTFATSSERQQVTIGHVVLPRVDYRTNHFGNLLGLCGWHFNLFRHGEWTFLDPNTNGPFEDINGILGWERMRNFILSRTPDTDASGNEYFTLPIRFSNVYQDWQPEPESVNEKIRYSKPHWKYLCELLKA